MSIHNNNIYLMYAYCSIYIWFMVDIKIIYTYNTYLLSSIAQLLMIYITLNGLIHVNINNLYRIIFNN